MEKAVRPLPTDESGAKRAIGALAWLALFGCSAAEEPFLWSRLPEGQPAPLVPDDNPMSDAKIELGRHLFYDPRLSADGTLSCSTCHRQELAFSDGERTPRGITNELLPRNSMGLTNVAYRGTYTWSNPVLKTLEDQALVPLLAEFPPELGLSNKSHDVLEALEKIELYQDLFAAAFDSTEISLTRVVQALGAFQRTLLSFDSPYDRYLSGDIAALSASAERGAALFFSEKAECYHCHGGPDFSDSYRTADQPRSPLAFQNNGLYDLDDQGAYPSPNVGLIEFTSDAADMGRFRVPTLRNIAVTAPYMHDGSLATLEEVVQHYNRGGPLRTNEEARRSPLQSTFVFPLGLSEEEQADLVAFLESLTDQNFLTDPRLSDPFVSRAP